MLKYMYAKYNDNWRNNKCTYRLNKKLVHCFTINRTVKELKLIKIVICFQTLTKKTALKSGFFTFKQGII
jgi:hypothetical protein